MTNLNEYKEAEYIKAYNETIKDLKMTMRNFIISVSNDKITWYIEANRTEEEADRTTSLTSCSRGSPTPWNSFRRRHLLSLPGRMTPSCPIPNMTCINAGTSFQASRWAVSKPVLVCPFFFVTFSR
jgi:hypothetical protein